MPATRRRRKLSKTADAVPYWRHSIDLGDGVVTNGQKPAAELEAQWAALGLPDLRRKTVLDVGAWDGYFSFRAEREGADRVVALDHHAWAVDHPRQHRYWKDCRENGTRPAPSATVADIWQPDQLPGKAGFDAAHRALGSKVESLVGDFLTMDLDRLGRFDVVLFLGGLPQALQPLTALKRLNRVTGELLVIETEAVAIPGFEHHAFWEFFEGNELHGDVDNWWAPNRRALLALCRTAGFGEVESVDSGSQPRSRDALHRYRLVVKARKPQV